MIKHNNIFNSFPKFGSCNSLKVNEFLFSFLLSNSSIFFLRTFSHSFFIHNFMFPYLIFCYNDNLQNVSHFYYLSDCIFPLLCKMYSLLIIWLKKQNKFSFTLHHSCICFIYSLLIRFYPSMLSLKKYFYFFSLYIYIIIISSTIKF